MGGQVRRVGEEGKAGGVGRKGWRVIVELGCDRDGGVGLYNTN